MEILLLLLLFQLKHYYADFFIQSYRQTVCKGIYGNLVGLSHSLEHVVATLLMLLLANCFFPINATAMLGVAFLELVIHYHIDFVKMRYGTKNTQTSRFWREFGLDQFLHQLSYVLFIYILTFSNL